MGDGSLRLNTRSTEKDHDLGFTTLLPNPLDRGEGRERKSKEGARLSDITLGSVTRQPSPLKWFLSLYGPK